MQETIQSFTHFETFVAFNIHTVRSYERVLNVVFLIFEKLLLDTSLAIYFTEDYIDCFNGKIFISFTVKRSFELYECFPHNQCYNILYINSALLINKVSFNLHVSVN